MFVKEKHIYPMPTYGIAVDGSTYNGNPGTSEYRGVDIATRREVFRVKVGFATNNLAEYFGIVHAVSYIYTKNLINYPIYSDSQIARTWVANKRANTHFDWKRNKSVLELFVECEKYIRERKALPKIYCWSTRHWGENIADFGRK